MLWLIHFFLLKNYFEHKLVNVNNNCCNGVSSFKILKHPVNTYFEFPKN